jgi:hypothetical protein
LARKKLLYPRWTCKKCVGLPFGEHRIDSEVLPETINVSDPDANATIPPASEIGKQIQGQLQHIPPNRIVEGRPDQIQALCTRDEKAGVTRKESEGWQACVRIRVGAAEGERGTMGVSAFTT